MMCAMPIRAARRIAAAVAVITLIAACTDDGASRSADPATRASTPGSASSPSPGDHPADVLSPRREMREAVRTLIEDNTGTYATQWIDGSEFLLTVEGTYRLNPIAYTTEAKSFADGNRYSVSTIVVGNEGWLRFNEPEVDPETLCWVHLDSEFFTFAGLGTARASNLFPYAVGVALLGRVDREVVIDTIEGTSDLFMTMVAVDPDLAGAFRLPPTSKARTDVDFDIDNGRITAWSTELLDVVTSALDAGYELRDQKSSAAALVGRGGTVKTQLTDPTLDVDIRHPPRAKVVEFVNDPDELEAALQVCAAGPATA
jgi:hypothetical protein